MSEKQVSNRKPVYVRVAVAGTFMTCLVLAPLDGGLSAFASFAAFKAAFLTGSLTYTELFIGTSAAKCVDYVLTGDDDSFLQPTKGMGITKNK